MTVLMARTAGWVPWVVWMMLIIGLGLVTAELWRNSTRLKGWKRLRALGQGSVVVGDFALRVGQSAIITPDIYSDPEAEAERQYARITALDRKTLALRLDGALSIPTVRNREWPDWLRRGASVSVTVTGDTALYRLEGRVRDLRAEDATPLLTISRPLWLIRIQRRQHVRADMDLPATVEPVAGPKAGGSAAAPLHATLRNLSAGGLCADLDCGTSANRAAELIEKFASDTVLKVRLPLPTLSDTPLLIRVCTCNRVIVRHGLGVRITGVFLPMPAWEQEMLVHHVFQAQREQLRARFGQPAA